MDVITFFPREISEEVDWFDEIGWDLRLSLARLLSKVAAMVLFWAISELKPWPAINWSILNTKKDPQFYEK